MTRPDAADTAGSAAAALVPVLVRAGATLAVAESLTGGALCAALVAVPGASRCFRGGVVAYATELKAALLGVDPALLAEHGAVHPEVAVAMAAGVRERLGATFGLATTGVAGPEPQDGHPPGTYHVALVGPAGAEVVSAGPPAPPASAGDRSAVRAAACAAALGLALHRLGDAPHPSG